MTDSDCGTTPLHFFSSSSQQRIAHLEKELNHYRTEYEIKKINDALKLEEHMIQTHQKHIPDQGKVLSSSSSSLISNIQQSFDDPNCSKISAFSKW